jgi:hypothetical protein
MRDKPLFKAMSLVIAVGAVVMIAGAPQADAANEIALARGIITLHEAPAGQRSPSCSELVVEARDALDNHLIAQTHPTTAADGTCDYAISVPAQSAVWLHARPVLVAAARLAADGTAALAPAPSLAHRAATGRGVQIRFTIISPSTYFFAPGEQKTVPLTY